MAECQDLLLSTSSELKENETKEERTEKLCEPCKEEGKSLRAKGYCLDCREYLCETCFDSHCRPRPMRKHQLCSTDEVPDSVKENTSEKKDDISPLVCQIHDKNVIVSYCETHRQFCCERCLSIGHVACKDLKNITRFKKEEFESFCESMKSFKKKWECEKQRALTNLSDVNCCYENTINFVTNKLGEMKAADSAYMGSVISACESTITQLDEWLSDVEEFKETGKNMNWLLFMQSTKDQLQVMDTYIHASFHKSEITRYWVANVKPLATSFISIAKTPFLLKMINVGYITDHRLEKKEIKISDIICLNESRIIVADHNSNSVSLIDNHRDIVISRRREDDIYMYMSNVSPVQMSIGDHNDVFVLHLGYRPKIVRLQAQQNALKLKVMDKIELRTKYNTIEYYNHRLRVIGGSPLQLSELTLDGNLKRLVSENLSQAKIANGQSLISSVSFSTVDKTTGSLFVPGHESIVEIKHDGTVELFAHSVLLKDPQNIRVLEDSLLVASLTNKNVYRVYRSGHVVSVLPEPLDFPVVAIDYNVEDRLLYVGGENDFVHVYQL